MTDKPLKKRCGLKWSGCGSGVQVQWSTMKDFAEAIGYGWVVGMLALFVAQQTAERSLDLSLSQWTDDPQLNNLTALPPDSSDRLYLNNYYLTVYAGFGLIHGKQTLAACHSLQVKGHTH